MRYLVDRAFAAWATTLAAAALVAAAAATVAPAQTSDADGAPQRTSHAVTSIAAASVPTLHAARSGDVQGSERGADRIATTARDATPSDGVDDELRAVAVAADELARHARGETSPPTTRHDDTADADPPTSPPPSLHDGVDDTPAEAEALMRAVDRLVAAWHAR